MMERNSPEFIEQLVEYRFRKHVGEEDYKEYKWAEDFLKKISKYGFNCGMDYYDLVKAKETAQRLQYKYCTKADEETAENHTTTHYVWHTQEDDKVRSSHAANNSGIFSWDNLPATGNPGEDYGCRCWAEPYIAKNDASEFIHQEVNVVLPDDMPAWEDKDFLQHYFTGHGQSVTLHQIGHLQTVIFVAEEVDQSNGSIFERVEDQICTKARAVGAGSFPYSFRNSYEFEDYIYSIGGATVGGSGKVNVEDNDDYLLITAEMDYYFRDVFTDAFSINEIIRYLGESETIKLAGLAFGISILGVSNALELFELIRKEMNLSQDLDPNSIGEWDLPGSTAYEITDTWSTHIEAIIRKDSSKSKYPDNRF